MFVIVDSNGMVLDIINNKEDVETKQAEAAASTKE